MNTAVSCAAFIEPHWLTHTGGPSYLFLHWRDGTCYFQWWGLRYTGRNSPTWQPRCSGEFIILKHEKEVTCIPYNWETFEGETFANWRKIRFLQRKLSWIACWCHRHTPNFAEKFFLNNCKPWNWRQFSPSKVSRYTMVVYVRINERMWQQNSILKTL